jgi:hypothetical protein
MNTYAPQMLFLIVAKQNSIIFMDPTSILTEILEKIKSNQIDDEITWKSVEVVLKSLHNVQVGFEVEHLIDDILLLLFQKWSKVFLIYKQSLVSASAFSSYLQCTKLWNAIQSLKETGLFTLTVVNDLLGKLAKIKDLFNLIEFHGDQTYLVQGLAAFKRKIEACEQAIQDLKTEYESISPVLLPIRSRLIEIKLELVQLLARKNPHAFSLVEVQVIQEEVREIDSARIDGKFMTKDQSVIPGQASVIDLLEQCFDDIHELLASKDPVDSKNPLRDVYEDLIKIKAHLEQLCLCSRWYK